MTLKYTHYTNFGANLQPSVADAEGFVAYRTDFQTTMPYCTWTSGERWIDVQERRIAQAR